MTDQQYPHPTVGAMIFNQGGKFLLVRSHKWRDKYVIPGGHIELGERIEEALRREIKEETNLEIYDIEFLKMQEFIFDASFYKKGHFIFLDHVCKTDSERVILNDEAESFVWVTVEKALELPIEPYTRILLEACIEKNIDTMQVSDSEM